ncbi:alpha/beta fold hydrolase [Nocardia macrotermitis]|uniref:Soluble epoxide hydrolase n=1 Tax=Nocardia macrotermitis TaxID=2585198 RepID=A0A7K0DEM6_9NOCA|nr:alpha/beta hydrolase [Nocardia macrotermitis]MQY24167.1 Soluble epoxide hydrolase [Nocardia macrotermitis]
MSTAAEIFEIPTGTGSVTDSPHLPDGFADVFGSRFVDIGELRLHAVVGGEGTPLLLIGGWPQTWYAWRLIMPTLARNYRVVAVDPRGVGLSDKPFGGYDTGTLAADLVRLMSALGHDRFAVVGHDVGMWIGYALAADHPERVDRLAVLEAALPGLLPSPPLMGENHFNDLLWHFAFNRLSTVNEELVRGREGIFFGYQFRHKAATPTALPDHAVRHYIDTLAADPDALRASFDFYRALDATMHQNAHRRTRQLTLPVLAIGGAECSGDRVAATMRAAATEVTGLQIPHCGHFPAEEAPDALLAALLPFLERPDVA